jgi:hypothetical protein
VAVAPFGENLRAGYEFYVQIFINRLNASKSTFAVFFTRPYGYVFSKQAGFSTLTKNPVEQSCFNILEFRRIVLPDIEATTGFRLKKPLAACQPTNVFLEMRTRITACCP